MPELVLQQPLEPYVDIRSLIGNPRRRSFGHLPNLCMEFAFLIDILLVLLFVPQVPDRCFLIAGK